MEQVTLQIDGMSCGHCLNAVNKAVAGVRGVQVNEVKMGQARVAVDSAATTEKLISAITEAGYPATVVSTTA